MKFCLYVNQITPHLLPLAQAMVALYGADEVRYIYVIKLERERCRLGWQTEKASWIINRMEQAGEAEKWLVGSEVLICERRELDLWERRAKSGKGMYYTSERWFKPILGWLPGWLRLMHPKFFLLMRKAVQLFDRYPNLNYLADGVFAAQDFQQVREIMSGRLTAFASPPVISCERHPFAKIFSNGRELPQIKLWGYFVAPTSNVELRCEELSGTKRILWVGRYLWWKRLDTLIDAVVKVLDCTLDIYGTGPCEQSYKKRAKGCSRIKFYPSVPVSEVRQLMLNHDIYVLPSNGYEGWGAVVSEALESGMRVLGTKEAGATATLLPDDCLFRAGDVAALMQLLSRNVPNVGIRDWSALDAARKIQVEHI